MIRINLLSPKERPRVCSVAGCGQAYLCKGYCQGHWRQHHAGLPITPLKRPKTTAPKPGHKYCHVCKRECPIDDFYRVYKDSDKLQGQCKPCRKELLHSWQIRSLYGVSKGDYEVMLEVQGHACAICALPFGRRRGSIDHCHETGQVRGVLCDNCNLGIGLFQDDPARLSSAAEYLSRIRVNVP